MLEINANLIKNLQIESITNIITKRELISVCVIIIDDIINVCY